MYCDKLVEPTAEDREIHARRNALQRARSLERLRDAARTDARVAEALERLLETERAPDR